MQASSCLTVTFHNSNRLVKPESKIKALKNIQRDSETTIHTFDNQISRAASAWVVNLYFIYTFLVSTPELDQDSSQ